MVYSPDGEVFWDYMTGIRRWHQISFGERPADTMYQVVALLNQAPHWFGARIAYAVVDDFGNLVRVQ
jgi:hypothetical protein